ncbi:MAG: M56 family metallopeptidase [Rhodothermales bacterium]|nr:M56 family metallopeptidase [Rhodothermales bacterium]
MASFLAKIPPALVDAIGSALLHFLWQGALVALGLAIALRLFRGASGEFRYALCVGALVLIVLLPATTAVSSYLASTRIETNGALSPMAPAFESPPDAAPPASGQTTEPTYASPAPPLSRWDLLRFMALQIHVLVFRLWLYALPVFLLRLTFGYFGLVRLRRSSLPLTDPRWIAAVDSRRERMGITRRVRLATSEALAQPALIGWLKPMIVLPAGILAGLPPAHIEALLVHELAHIRRHDALVTYLQALLETLLFYHPAVWYVSRRLRIEREFACDEASVRALGDDLTYVRALAGLEERRGPALALGASDGRLVDRIRRIVEYKKRPAKAIQTPSWALATVAVLAAGTLLAACARNPGKAIEGTPDELFLQAVEQVKQGDFFRAQEIAEPSAEQGNLCSMQLLAELLAGNPFPAVGRPEFFYPGMPWLGQDEAASRAWADRLEETLHERAEAGDGGAMLWLSYRHKPDWRITSFWPQGDNDSLAQHWFARALEAGHPIARRSQAVKLAREERLEEADLLFEELARAGDSYALWAWSWIYMDTRRNRVDPERYFAIASLAVELEAEGVHEWLGERLRELQEQAAQGNPEAKAYLEVVNRHQLIERLAALPEKAWDPGRYIIPPLCEGQSKLYELTRLD